MQCMAADNCYNTWHTAVCEFKVKLLEQVAQYRNKLHWRKPKANLQDFYFNNITCLVPKTKNKSNNLFCHQHSKLDG